ncbi:MAG: hypothetical protein ABIL09_28385 [Gemmatimonadota bacterium]
MIELSHQPQLFLDDLLVARAHNLRRRLQQPDRHPANPLVVQEHPWERHSLQCYGNALYDEQAQRFRLWYFAAEQRDPDDVPWTVPGGGAAGRPLRLYRTCYAESGDGVGWVRPMVNALETPLYPDHNILIEDIHSACVLDEPDDPDPARRYKVAGGRTLGFSPDGLHWHTRPWEAVGKNDTGTSVLRWRGRYLAYVRQQESHPPDWPLVRAVGLAESDDFVHWTPKRTVLRTDALDGFPFTQPYGLTVFPCGDVLVGLLWMILLDRVEAPERAWKWNNRVGDLRTELVVSRDGERWQRVADRAPFLEPGPGAWERARVYPGTSVLAWGDELRFYYTGADARHGEGPGRTGIGLACLPAERLVAVERDGTGEPGLLETPPLALPAGDLVVNADLSGGGLAVELLDPSGVPLPGSDATGCRLQPVDSRRWRVAWAEGAPIQAGPALGAVTLRFLLTGARLFSFRVRAP